MQRPARVDAGGRAETQNSGLLIRGFGVRVPGGAPVLTWADALRAWPVRKPREGLLVTTG